MEEFIKCDTNSSMILEHIRIRKIIGECNICAHNLNDKFGQIYSGSIPRDAAKPEFPEWPNFNISPQIVKKSFEQLFNVLRNDNYITSKNIAGPQANWITHNFPHLQYETKLPIKKIINKNVFFLPVTGVVLWGHVMMYALPLLHVFPLLKKQVPDLELIITNDPHPFMNHVLEIFKSDYSLDITFINNNEKIVNNGTTFFACNCKGPALYYTEDQINSFFTQYIVKKTLSSITTLYDTPKKLILMRKPGRKLLNQCLIGNVEEIIDLANSYGYIDMDQTKWSPQESIYRMNQATHIILESGSAILHLPWNINIKPIIIIARYMFLSNMGSIYENSIENLQYIGQHFSDLATFTKSKIVHNDFQIIYDSQYKPNAIYWHNRDIKFTNMLGLENAIQDNENTEPDTTIRTYHNIEHMTNGFSGHRIPL